MHYIYCITHLATQRMYIGQTVNPKKRWRQHLAVNSKCSYLYSALIKYGKNAFEIVIIDECDNIDEANTLESYYIAKYNTTNPKLGFNLTSGGDHAALNKATRMRMSFSHKGKTHSEETKRKIGAAHSGKILSDETKSLIAAAHIGMTDSEETRRKKSLALKGRVSHKKGKPGRPQTEEEKRACSIRNKGKVLSVETKQKISEARKGKPLSEEHKKKIALGLRAARDLGKRK